MYNVVVPPSDKKKSKPKRVANIYKKKFWLLERGWKEDLEMHELELRRLQEDSNKRFGELKRAYEQAERRAPLLSVR